MKNDNLYEYYATIGCNLHLLLLYIRFLYSQLNYTLYLPLIKWTFEIHQILFI